jgi:ketohexokinase
MACVLAVGVITLDLVHEVDHYPREDAEVRALSHSARRGGNATNTLVVLSELGHDCEWAGVWVDEPDAAILRADLDRYAIGAQYARQLTGGKIPTSYITSSRATGSRTIVHYRDLPEFELESFVKIPLQRFDWVHFEGRDVPETQRMMQHLRSRYPGLAVSLEVEKPREGIEVLFPYVDLLLFSKAFADHLQRPAEAMLQGIHNQVPETDLVCALSADGAVALSRNGEWLHSAAWAPATLVDTRLGVLDFDHAAQGPQSPFDLGVDRKLVTQIKLDFAG